MASHLKLVDGEVTLETLKKYTLIYLASPYMLYAKGLSSAFEEVTELAAKLVAKEINVFAPITYGHPMTIYGNLAACSEKIWYPLNDAFMHKSDALLIARMPGWNSSKGVGREIKYFEMTGKPVFHINHETMDVY